MAGRDDEDFALGIREDVGMNWQVFGWLLPIVNPDPVDEEAPFGDVEVFGFQFMTLPGADGGSFGMGDGVEAFDVFEMKIVDVADGAPVVGVDVAFDEHGLGIERR